MRHRNVEPEPYATIIEDQYAEYIQELLDDLRENEREEAQEAFLEEHALKRADLPDPTEVEPDPKEVYCFRAIAQARYGTRRISE